VREVLDKGAQPTHGMIQESGATFAYDRQAPDGSRVSRVEIGGSPLDEKKLYRVLTNDYLAQGGEGYTPFARAEKTEMTRTLVRDVFADCARAQRTIKAPVMGRMTPKSAEAR
jgi:2',3'-cyclic-nucleotide 2'-phosphodiesterase (5'-nucleotidase family)